MYLITFLFEEAKHADFFSLLLQNIGIKGELYSFHTPVYRKLFEKYCQKPWAAYWMINPRKPLRMLPLYIICLQKEYSLKPAIGRSYESLVNIGKMPGLLEGITHIKRDESRHIGFGTFLLQRLISENPNMLDHVLNKLEGLMPFAIELSETMRPGRSKSIWCEKIG